MHAAGFLKVWQQSQPGAIDDFVRPHELAAIEVYSPTTTPAEYEGMHRSYCATALYVRCRTEISATQPDRLRL